MVAPDSDTDSNPTPAGPALSVVPPVGRLWGLTIVAGLLCGLAAWLAGEAVLGAYRSALDPKIRREVSPDAIRQYSRALLDSASGTFAALGAILGLGLGLAGGLARRSARAGAAAALLGVAVGSIAGASTSLLVLPHFYKAHDPQSQDLMPPLLTLGSIGVAVGAAGGLALGVGLGGPGRWAKSLAGGLVGAGLGVVAYEFVGAIAFPAGKTELPISNTATTRFLFHALLASMAAIGSATALTTRKRDAAPPGT